MGHPTLCREHSRVAEQSRRKIHRKQREGSPRGGDELPLDRQQVKEGGGEDPQIWPSEMGTEAANPGYNIKRNNIIINVLGGWSRDVDATMTKLFRTRGQGILHQMQRAVRSGMLNIARTFKIVS